MTARQNQQVLLVHRYFDPDMTTYAQMLARYADHLGRLGHTVTVLCGPADYNAVYDGPTPPRHEQREHYHIVRARLPSATGIVSKALGFVLFPLVVVTHCWRRGTPYDLVSVTTMPPLVMGLAGAFGSRRGGGQFVYHCMDLYPELLGRPASTPLRVLASVARWLDRATMRRAACVIVLSADMEATVRARGDAGISLAVCNNFIIETWDQPLPTHRESTTEAQFAASSDNSMRLIFAGNLGRFQGIDRIIDAFRNFDRPAELLFLGAGTMVPTIEAAARDDERINHHPHVPLREAMAKIIAFDVAIVSLEPGVIDTAFPSKVLMYLELGRPMIALIEPDSTLARTVERERLGVTASPNDRAAILEAFEALAGERVLRAPDEIQSFARANFSESVILDRWTSLYGLESS